MKKYISLLFAVAMTLFFACTVASVAPAGQEAKFFIGAIVLTLFGAFARATSSNLRGIFSVETGPQSVVADYFNNFISGFDLNKREVLPRLQRRYGTQGREFLDMLMALGFERTSAIEILEHFEENWIVENFQVLEHAAGAANAAVDLTLSPNSLDSNNRYYVEVNDVVEFKTGVRAQVTAIDVSTPSAPVITVVPRVLGQAIPAVEDDEYLIIPYNDWSEGSGQPNGRAQGAWHYTNTYMTTKASITGSGAALATESWINTVDTNNIQGWVMKGVQIDLDHRMAVNIQGGWLTGDAVTNPLAVDTTNSNASLIGTEGLFPYMDRVSIPFPYIPGNFAMQDFDQMNNLLTGVWAPRTVCGMLGQNLEVEITNMLQEYFKFGQINNTTDIMNKKFYQGDADMAAVVGFKYVTKNPRTFCLKSFESLTDPKLYGSPGFVYPQRGLWFPLEKGRDPKTKNDIPALGIVYRALGSKNRKMSIWNTGAAEGGLQTGDLDIRKYNMRSQFAAEFFGGVAFINQTPQ